MFQIDINTASRERIRLLRGIGWVHAARIIAARPFKTPYELVTRCIMSEDRFDRIAAEITTGRDACQDDLAKSADRFKKDVDSWLEPHGRQRQAICGAGQR